MALKVLLLDEGFPSGAHAAIGLRDAGCRVTVLAGTGGGGGHTGRDIAWALAPPVASDAFLEAATRIVRRDGISVVYPVTEPIQRRIWDATPEWAEKVFPATQKWQREVLGDKALLSDFVRARGVRVPAYRVVRSDADIHEAIEELGVPVVVRGVVGRGGSATRIAASRGEALKAADRLRSDGVACFLQRHVCGATCLVGGVFDAGRPVRLYAGEKLDQHPARTGPAIRMRSIAEPALVEAALAVFRATRSSGLASVDFIRDEDGSFLFLELNPRPWGSLTAASEAGVNLFTPLAELLGGESPSADLEYEVGVESTVFPLYLLSRSFWRSGRVAKSLLRDLRGDNGAPWRQVGQAAHLLHRLHRVGRNWPH